MLICIVERANKLYMDSPRVSAWPNKPLLPTRTVEAPGLAAQRRR